jgi:uncharacterized protein
MALPMKGFTMPKRMLLVVLLLGLASCATRQGDITSSPAATAVTFAASDGTSIHGTLYGQGTTGIIISNMSDNAATDWDPFPATLAQHGYRVLTYQYRLDATTTQDVHDLLSGIAWMRLQGVQRLALIGGSMGGLVTLMAAAQQSIATVVVLSAALSYGDVTLTTDIAHRLTMPKLVVAASSDSLTDPAALMRLLPLPSTEQLYPGFDHGATLLTAHADLPGIIQSYLENNGAAA